MAGMTKLPLNLTSEPCKPGGRLGRSLSNKVIACSFLLTDGQASVTVIV